MPLSPGEKLGPYEIIASIGKGGMGEVWRARDPRLGRDVAIKVSAQQFTDRFEREAKVIASLNHPNICTLHDVGPNYLVMELVEGTPLTGPLPLEKAVEYAGQILDALDAAHRKGITHRDLKPANVLVTKQGIKLLDFGLAKMSAGLGPDDLTVQHAITAEGQISGTLQYMSPEQLNGRAADARSDIFAFGCVLYEMLSGKKAFAGSTAASVIAAIMEREPEPLRTTPPLDRVIRTCLAKEPDKRFQNALDLKRDLLWAVESDTAAAAASPYRSLSKLWLAAAALLAVTTGVALFALWRMEKPVDHLLSRLTIDLGPDVQLPAINRSGTDVILSPDGTRLVFKSGTPPKLFTRRLDQPDAVELPGTEGAFGMFFSPDSQWIGFSAGKNICKISVNGGAVVVLAESGYSGASWSEDGFIYVSEGIGRGLLKIPSAGGAPEVALARVDAGHVRPDLLPGGKAVLFVTDQDFTLENDEVEVLTFADRKRKVVARGGQNPHFVRTPNGAGYLIYTTRSSLFAIPFDPDKLETHGTAVPILDDMAYDQGTWTGQFSLSAGPSGHGTLVYRKNTGKATARSAIQWMDATGGKELFSKSGPYWSLRLSPDSKRVALEADGVSGGHDILVYDPQRDSMSRLTFGKTYSLSPAWSPDGQYVVFSGYGLGLFSTRADGAGQPQLVIPDKGMNSPSFSPDGRRLTYESYKNGIFQIATAPVEVQNGQLKAGKPEILFTAAFNAEKPVFSPDGHWLAYQADDSGKLEVYVRPFPLPSSGLGGKWQISNSGGFNPRWSRNGHELIYQSGDAIMAATWSANGDTFVAEKPRVWLPNFRGSDWDLAPDGKRIAVLTPNGPADAQPPEHEVVFLENFFDELQRKVPAGK